MSIFKISLQIYEFILTYIFIHFFSVNRYFIREACSCLLWVNSVSFCPFYPKCKVFVCLFVCFVLFCFVLFFSVCWVGPIITFTRLPAKSSNLWNRSTIPNVSVSLFRADRTIFSKYIIFGENAKVDYLNDPHTHRLWCRPLSHVIVHATHRQPPFLAASQSASRLISSLVVGLRRDIVTHRPDNVRFCSLDSVPCRSHSSLAVVLSLKVVSTRQRILLTPLFAVACRHNFAILTFVTFRRLSAATMWARF